jgi:hypothetical protein
MEASLRCRREVHGDGIHSPSLQPLRDRFPDAEGAAGRG